MTDVDEVKWAAWHLVKQIQDRTVRLDFGEGKGMIGCGQKDGAVVVAFFDGNGSKKAKEVGVELTEKEKKKADSVPPRVTATFSNKESLLVLRRMVDRGLEYFAEKGGEK